MGNKSKGGSAMIYRTKGVKAVKGNEKITFRLLRWTHRPFADSIDIRSDCTERAV